MGDSIKYDTSPSKRDSQALDDYKIPKKAKIDEEPTPECEPNGDHLASPLAVQSDPPNQLLPPVESIDLQTTPSGLKKRTHSLNEQSFTPKPLFGNHLESFPSELKAMFEPLFCKLCKAPLSSTVTAYSHYHGKVHIRNVISYLIKNQLPLPEGMQSPKKTWVSNEDHSEDSFASNIPPELKEMFLPLDCKLCNVTSQSPIPARAHYTGKQHNKKVKEWILLNHKKGAEADEKPVPLICSVCNITLTSVIHANQHYLGKKHRVKAKNICDDTIPVPVATEDPSGRFGIGQAHLKDEVGQ